MPFSLTHRCYKGWDIVDLADTVYARVGKRKRASYVKSEVLTLEIVA